MPDWAIIVDVFGPLAAVAVMLWFVFKYLKPKADEADKEKSDRIKLLEADVARLNVERETAKDSVIAAFGDIGDSFEQFAADVRGVVEYELDAHETGATTRHEKLLSALDRHKDEIIQKLDGHSRDVRN